MKTDRKVFLFQGDSITDGNWSRESDPNHILGHGFVFYVAAALEAGAAKQVLKFYNRGKSGDNSRGMRLRWEEEALKLHPDVLTVLIGINDCAVQVTENADPQLKKQTSIAQYEDNIRYCLTEARKQNPALKILLGLPFYYRVTGLDSSIDPEIDEKEYLFTEKIRQSAQYRCQERLIDIAGRQEIIRILAREFDAELLDFPAVFHKAFQYAPVQHWIWDGVHPTTAAHGLMANEWLKVYSGKFQ